MGSSDLTQPPNIVTKKQWSTHMPLLIKALSLTTKDVLEMGSGFFSTPLLHWICKYKNNLYTYENNSYFFEFARQFQSRKHRIRFVENWDDLKVDHHWGIVFIDNQPDERRGSDAIRFKDNADYVIIHDTGWPDIFGCTTVWEHFKYSYTWKDCSPWTSVLSNFHSLEEFQNLG